VSAWAGGKRQICVRPEREKRNTPADAQHIQAARIIARKCWLPTTIAACAAALLETIRARLNTTCPVLTQPVQNHNTVSWSRRGSAPRDPPLLDTLPQYTPGHAACRGWPNTRRAGCG
jgi:hypothetical protein